MANIGDLVPTNGELSDSTRAVLGSRVADTLEPGYADILPDRVKDGVWGEPSMKEFRRLAAVLREEDQDKRAEADYYLVAAAIRDGEGRPLLTVEQAGDLSVRALTMLALKADYIFDLVDNSQKELEAEVSDEVKKNTSSETTT